MRLTQAESERNRKQILEVAGRLFRERGFDGVGVDGLMKVAAQRVARARDLAG